MDSNRIISPGGHGEIEGSYRGEGGRVYKGDPPPATTKAAPTGSADGFDGNLRAQERRAGNTQVSAVSQEHTAMANSLEQGLKNLPWSWGRFKEAIASILPGRTSRVSQIEKLIKQLRTGSKNPNDVESLLTSLVKTGPEAAKDWLYTTITTMRTSARDSSRSSGGQSVDAPSTTSTVSSSTSSGTKVKSLGPGFQAQKKAVLDALSKGGHPQFIRDIVNAYASHVSEQTKDKSAEEKNKIYQQAIEELGINSGAGVLGYVTRANQQKQPISGMDFCNGLTLSRNVKDDATRHDTVRANFATQPLANVGNLGNILDKQIPFSSRDKDQINRLSSMMRELDELEPPTGKGGDVVSRSNLNEEVKKIALQNATVNNINEKEKQLSGLLKETVQQKVQAALNQTKTSMFRGYTAKDKDEIRDLLTRYFATNPDVENLTWLRENISGLNDTTYKAFKTELETKTLTKELALDTSWPKKGEVLTEDQVDRGKALVARYIANENPDVAKLNNLKEGIGKLNTGNYQGFETKLWKTIGTEAAKKTVADLEAEEERQRRTREATRAVAAKKQLMDQINFAWSSAKIFPKQIEACKVALSNYVTSEEPSVRQLEDIKKEIGQLDTGNYEDFIKKLEGKLGEREAKKSTGQR